MPHQRPRDTTILQLLHANFSGVRAIGLVKYVLRRDLDSLAEVLAREQQVERGRRDDDFGVRVAFSIV